MDFKKCKSDFHICDPCPASYTVVQLQRKETRHNTDKSKDVVNILIYTIYNFLDKTHYI